MAAVAAAFCGVLFGGHAPQAIAPWVAGSVGHAFPKRPKQQDAGGGAPAGGGGPARREPQRLRARRRPGSGLFAAGRPGAA